MALRINAKNIGFFDSYRVWGGGEKWHEEMALYMSSLRHDVTVFTPSGGELHRRVLGKLRLQNISVDKLSYMNPKHQFSYFRKFRRLDLDVLVFNSFIDVRAAAIAAKKAGVKKTILRIGTPIAPKEKLSYIYSFQNGLDEIVGISKENLDVFYRDAPKLIEGKPTRVIPNAIDLDKFKKVPRDENQVITFGNCVRLTEQKGLMDLLEAVEQLKKMNFNFKVLLAGDGEDREKLISYCEENNLREVEFLGHVEDTAAFYNRLDFLVFTSRFEGTARTILESMACQVPVISYAASSMKELIKDEINGASVKPFDVKDLIEKISSFIENKHILAELGENGRRQVEADHNREVVYQRWGDYLTQ